MKRRVVFIHTSPAAIAPLMQFYGKAAPELEADRTEFNNLAERRPEIVKDLSARWEAWAKRTHIGQWLGPRRNDWGEVPKPEKQNYTPRSIQLGFRLDF